MIIDIFLIYQSAHAKGEYQELQLEICTEKLYSSVWDTVSRVGHRPCMEFPTDFDHANAQLLSFLADDLQRPRRVCRSHIPCNFFTYNFI